MNNFEKISRVGNGLERPVCHLLSDKWNWLRLRGVRAGRRCAGRAREERTRGARAEGAFVGAAGAGDSLTLVATGARRCRRVGLRMAFRIWMREGGV